MRLNSEFTPESFCYHTTMESNIYYTYAWLRVDGSPYYIGKGQRKRAWRKSHKGVRRPKDESRVLILKQNLTENESFRHEVYMISVFGRKDLGTGILHNRTNGGEGSSGRVCLPSTRKRIGTMRERVGGTRYGPHSEESKRKMSESHKGKKLSEVTRKKISESGKGRVLGDLSKQKLRDARAKQSPPTLGQKRTPEQRERMRQGALNRWARSRGEI